MSCHVLVKAISRYVKLVNHSLVSQYFNSLELISGTIVGSPRNITYASHDTGAKLLLLVGS